MLTRTNASMGLCGLLLFVVAPATADGADDDQQYTLRYRFEAGQSVEYTVENQSRLNLQKGPATQLVEHRELTDKRYTVRSVDADGNAELDLQIDRVRMTAGVDGANSVTFDSDSGEEPPTDLEGIAETVGKPHVRVKVSPTGHLLSIDWLVGQENTQKPTVKDEASLDILAILPEEPWAVGQTWKQPFEAEVRVDGNLQKSVRLQREYTLTKVEENLATITLKTSVLTPLFSPTEEYQIINKLFRGTVVFDLSRGVVVSRSLKVDRVVVGFEGGDSKAHNVSTRTEKLIEKQIASDTGAGDRQ